MARGVRFGCLFLSLRLEAIILFLFSLIAVGSGDQQLPLIEQAADAKTIALSNCNFSFVRHSVVTYSYSAKFKYLCCDDLSLDCNYNCTGKIYCPQIIVNGAGGCTDLNHKWGSVMNASDKGARITKGGSENLLSLWNVLHTDNCDLIDSAARAFPV